MYYEIVQQLGQEYGMAKQAAAAGIEARRILDSIDLVKSAAVRDADFMAQVAELSKIASYGELAMEYMEKVAANKLFQQAHSKYTAAMQELNRLKNKGADPKAIAVAEENAARAARVFDLAKQYPNMGAKELRARAKALGPFYEAVREAQKPINPKGSRGETDPQVANKRKIYREKVDMQGGLLNAEMGDDGKIKVDPGATAKDVDRAKRIGNAMQNNPKPIDASIEGGAVKVKPVDRLKKLFQHTGEQANSMLEYARKKFPHGNLAELIYPNGVPTEIVDPATGKVNSQQLSFIQKLRNGELPKWLQKPIRKAVQGGELPTPGPGGNAMADAAKQVAEQVADNYGTLPALSGQVADNAAKAQATREAITKYNPIGYSTGKAVERSLNTPVATAAKKFGKGKLGLLAGLVGLGGAGTYYALNKDDESNPLMAPNAAAAAATAFGGDGGNEWINGVPNWATALGGLGLAGAGAYGLSRAFSSDDEEEEKRKRRAM